MNNLLTSFALLCLTSMGIGFLFHRIMGKERVLIGEAGIWGLLVVGVLGNLLHFLIPINYAVSYLVGFAGIGYVLYLCITKRICRKNFQEHVLLLLLLFIYVIYCLYYSTITYDTTLYHLQTIKWNRIGPLPFGLANLHDRFGFNSLWFMSSSILYFNHSSPFVINGVLFFLFLCYLLQQTILLGHEKKSRHLIFLPIGFAFILMYSNYFFSKSIFGNNLFTSPATDFAATILFCYLMFSFILSILNRVKEMSFRFVLFAGLLVMVKLTYLPVFVFLFIFFLWQKRKNNISEYVKDRFVILTLLSFIIWIVRSVFLSGCLVFPVGITCLSHLSWSMPVKQVAIASEAIVHWAQSPGIHDLAFYTNWNWFSSWKSNTLHHIYIHQDLYILTILVVLEVYAYYFIQRQKNKDQNVSIFKTQLFSAFFFIFAYLYWFFLGPDIRFIQGYFIGVVYVVALPLLLSLGRYFQEIQINKIIQLGSIGLLLYFVLVNRNEMVWILKKGNQDKWPFLAKVELQYITNKQGIKIYYPKSGDQCSDTELICANHKKENLFVYQLGNRLMFREEN